MGEGKGRRRGRRGRASEIKKVYVFSNRRVIFITRGELPTSVMDENLLNTKYLKIRIQIRLSSGLFTLTSRNTRKESVILPNAALFFPPGAKTLPKDDRIAPECPIHPLVTASLCDSRNVRCLRRTRQAALSLTARVTSSTGLLSWTFLLWKRRRRSLSDPGNATPGRHLGEITRPNARRSSLPKHQLRFLPNREAGVDAFFLPKYFFLSFSFFSSPILKKTRSLIPFLLFRMVLWFPPY